MQVGAPQSLCRPGMVVLLCNPIAPTAGGRQRQKSAPKLPAHRREHTHAHIYTCTLSIAHMHLHTHKHTHIHTDANTHTQIDCAWNSDLYQKHIRRASISQMWWPHTYRIPALRRLRQEWGIASLLSFPFCSSTRLDAYPYRASASFC